MDGIGEFSDAVVDAAVKGFEKEKAAEREKAAKIEAENEEAFRRGTQGVFERRTELNAGFDKRRDEIADLYAKEFDEMPEALAGERQDARLAIAGEQTWSLKAPLWMQISGLYPNAHREMGPNERAGRIRILLRRVEMMVRWELKTMALKIENCEMKIENLNGGGERSVIEETALWSPVGTICVYLEISQRHLSGLCREITGMAIQEIVDRIKAETLRAEFKNRLKDFVSAWFGVAENWQASVGKNRGEIADAIFAELKASRRARFHRTQWAYELGYSSYQRLFRAALLSEGMTPHQLEIDVIEELVPEDEGARCVGGQNGRGQGLGVRGEGSVEVRTGGNGAEALNKEGKPAEAG